MDRLGSADPLGGGTDLRRGHFLVGMYVKMKELGPIGGGRASSALPGSATGKEYMYRTHE